MGLDLTHSFFSLGSVSSFYVSLFKYNIYYEIDPSIKYTDIVTVLSFVLAATIFLDGYRKDNHLKRKEYADNIRKSASTIYAKLERWKELNIKFFMDIQPIITKTELILEKSRNLEKFRDCFLAEISKNHAKCYQRIIDEQIEIAYKDLMGYDENVENCFSNAVNGLKYLDNLIILNLFYYIQHDLEDKRVVIQDHPNEVYCIDKYGKNYKNTAIGNIFQTTFNMHRLESESLMTGIIENFKIEIIRLITGGDDDIVDRKIIISSKAQEAYLLKAIEGLTLRLEGSQEKITAYAESLMENKEKSAEHIAVSKNKFQESINSYQAAIDIIDVVDNSPIKIELLAGFYAGRGLSYKALESYDEAQQSFEKALEFYRKSRNQKLLISISNSET